MPQNPETPERPEEQSPTTAASPEAVEPDAVDPAETAGDETAGHPLSREELVSQMQNELQEAQNRVLVVQAELENFRKRARRELEDERRFAAGGLVSDLLSVLDNLNRAIHSAASDPSAKSLLDGVKIVAQMFESVLEKHHCKRIASVGAAFDPNLHEAIGQQPSEEHPAGTVMLETQVGYQLHDRVIRPAQVFVSTGSPEAANES